MNVEPYLFFNGRCEEAAEFYCKALGAEVVFKMRFKENPEADAQAMTPPGAEDKIMHMNLRLGDKMIMMSDGQCNGAAKFDGFSLSLGVKGASEAKQFFEALVEGGQVVMPLGKTFFSPMFGMLADRFGVHWMVMAEQQCD